MKKSTTILAAALLAALATAPWLGAYPVFMMKLMCFVLFASAFNLLLGYTGLLSFGHAAFFGVAAYATGYAVKTWGFAPELGVLFGALMATTFGLFFGALAIRREGIAFSMITLALAQMVYYFAQQSRFTGGEDGLQSVPRGRLFGLLDLRDDWTMYYTVLLTVVFAMLVIVRIVNSPFGHVLRALKDNEARALSLGYDVERTKLLAFVLSATLSGLAGSLKTLVLGFASLSDVHWSTSGNVILMTLLGGLGTLGGPAVGATMLVVIENKIGELGTALATWTQIESLDRLGEAVPIVTGAIFLVCVLAFRQGVWGSAISWARRRLPR